MSGLSCSDSVFKIYMVIVNSIFIVSGVAIFISGCALGGTLVVALPMASGVYILIGIAVTVVSILGCCGSIKESEKALRVYAYILMIYSLIHIVTLVVMIANSTEEKIKTSSETFLRDLFDKYELYSYNDVTKATNKLQFDLECCGLDGPNYWKERFGDNYPPSCCGQRGIVYSNVPTCTRHSLWFQSGCKDRFAAYMKIVSNFYIGFSVLSIIFQLLTTFIAFSLAKAVREKHQASNPSSGPYNNFPGRYNNQYPTNSNPAGHNHPYHVLINNQSMAPTTGYNKLYPTIPNSNPMAPPPYMQDA